MTYTVKLVIASIIIYFTMVNNEVLASQDTIKNQISEAMEKIQTGASPDIRRQALEQLEKLTRKIKAENIDEKMLNDFVMLLDTPAVRPRISKVFENLVSRANRVAPDLVKLLIAKVRTGETSFGRNQAGVELALLTSKIKSKSIDDETLNDIIELLNMRENGIYAFAAVSVGYLGHRAKKAIPKLIQLLIEEECSYLNLDMYPTIPAAGSIRAALRRLGVEPPPRELFSTTSCANLDVLKKQIIGEMYGNCEFNDCID